MLEETNGVLAPSYKLYGRPGIVLASGFPFFCGLLIALNYHRIGQERNRDKSITITFLVFVMCLIEVIKNDFEVNFIFITLYLLQVGVAYLCYCKLQGDIIDMHVRRGGTLVSIHKTLAYNILFILFFFTIAFLIKQVYP
ncbi:hypothetical protein DQJ97_24155 [Salmonella enterica subsp. enterica serovar Poona]|nr:hypothetical protein [Salmonella enterica subsp. enterica serovar Poona]